ncbi:hypothetical protein CMUS01_08958 [Colletotrichum musicola]|uniref:Uncharacterized protein n=1 Tax=Colletotrichum musicola TaxID=2175873 RepID=A0A8H6KA73_9PEZI|nr:hypothetical protein CMUS01_08958 [Colletotrichum musicola]
MQINLFASALVGALIAVPASATCVTSWPGYTCQSTQLGCCLDISYGLQNQGSRTEKWRYDWTRVNCNTCRP